MRSLGRWLRRAPTCGEFDAKAQRRKERKGVGNDDGEEIAANPKLGRVDIRLKWTTIAPSFPVFLYLCALAPSGFPLSRE